MELFSLFAVTGIALFDSGRREIAASGALLQTVSAMLMILYIAALIGLLLPATIVLVGAGIVLGVIEVFSLVRRRKIPPVSITVFLILSLVYWTIHSGSALLYFDEYSHWGVYLKEMLDSNALWGSETNSLHPRYLPGTSLWQFFFAFDSVRPEGAAYLAQFTFLLAPLVVLWEKITWKQLPWHTGILLLVIIGVFNFGHGFTSLYVDHILGAWFIGILLNVLLDFGNRSFWRLLAYVLPLAVLVLVKTTGVFFAVAAAGIISLLFLVGTDLGGAAPWRAVRWRRAVGYSSLTIVACLAIIAVWSLNRDAVGATAESKIGSPAAMMAEIATGETILDERQRAELKRRFFDILLHQQVSKDEVSAQYNAFSYPIMSAYADRFRLTTFSMMGLSLIAMFALWHVLVDRQKRQDWIVVAAGTWLTAAAYIAALYFGTLYVTTSEYGMLWSSYIRYVHSMLLPVFIVCFSGTLPIFAGTHLTPVKLSEEIGVPRGAVAFVGAIVAMWLFESPYLASLYKKQEAHTFRAQIEPVTTDVRRRTGDGALWVFFPNDVENGALGHMLQYTLTPGRVHVEESPDRLLADPLSIRQELGEFDYLWFADKRPSLRAASELLVGQEIKGDGLYRIDASGSGITFTSVTQ